MTLRNIPAATSLAGVLLFAFFEPVEAQPEEPTVSVIGEVEKAGAYIYVEGQTVGQMIETAGGLKWPDAGRDVRAVLLRHVDGKATACLATPDTPTQPDDVITVSDVGWRGHRLCDEPAD